MSYLSLKWFSYRRPIAKSVTLQRINSFCTISVLPPTSLVLAGDRFLPQFFPEDNAELPLRGLTIITCLAMDLT
jgi:hypothetical protein